LEFDKSIIEFPSIKRIPGGASTDTIPDLQHPEDPAPLVKEFLQQPLPIPVND
jgi:arylsulfatase